MKRPVLLLVSGPAAGPAAGLHFEKLAGRNLITIDMGGTSFDTSLVRDGLPDMRSFSDIDRYRVATPLIDVYTIGAGGGSIASINAGLLAVGPESAEAHPGPACYMRGGTRPTVTDANVVVGLLNQTALLGGRFPIDANLSTRAMSDEVADSAGMDVEDAAAGVIEVVSRNMADAIREITVRRGYDPRDYTLVVGGGAGGLHAAQLADELGITRVVVPRIASAFCAFGAVVADVRHDYTRSYVEDTRKVDFAVFAALFEELEAQGDAAMSAEGVEEARRRFTRSLELRYKDQVYECAIDCSDLDLRGDYGAVRDSIETRFHQRHQQLYEFSQPGYACELVTMTVTALGASPPLRLTGAAGNGSGNRPPVAATTRPVRFDRASARIESSVFSGRAFESNQSVSSPAIIEEPNTTIVVPPGWTATFHGGEQAYVLERTESGA